MDSTELLSEDGELAESTLVNLLSSLDERQRCMGLEKINHDVEKWVTRTVVQQLFTCASSPDRFHKSRLLSLDILTHVLEKKLCLLPDIDLDCFEIRLYDMRQKMRRHSDALRIFRCHPQFHEYATRVQRLIKTAIKTYGKYASVFVEVLLASIQSPH
jgi:esterase/lipase superfamily enzyme